MAAIHADAFVQSRPWTAVEIADLLSLRHTHSVGETTCFAIYRVIADEAELLTIATHPDAQKQGFARKCLTQVHRKARELGATSLFLEVAADNRPARALYVSAGYILCGTRPRYYPRPDGMACDALLMSCDLTSG